MHRISPTCGSVLVVVCLAAIAGCDRGAEAPTSLPQESKVEATNGETVLSQEHDWNDKSRNELRATLRSYILGELRLMKYDEEAILEACRDIYVEDECPESETSAFLQFAADELKRAGARLASERSAWPAETDCDRLDRVELALRERGILLWQVSPCCDTCTFGDLPDRIDVISRRHPGFRDHLRGYAFFIDQNMPQQLADSTALSIYLGYGWLSPNNLEVDAEVYEANALGIAHEVCECLRAEGFDVDWDGDFARKIRLSMNWQRRDMLD